MEINVMEDILSFGATLIIGALMGVLFDLYRAFRRISKPKRILSFIEDILFWIIIIMIFFALLIMTTDGIQRGFVYIGCLGGLLIYMVLLSNIFLSFFIFVFELILKVVNEIIKVSINPIKGIIKKNRLNKIIKIPGVILKEMGRYVNIVSKKK